MKHQTSIPGTESDLDSVPEIRDAIYAALDADEAKKQAAETAKIKHDTVLRLLGEAARDSYPYLDARTGKRKLYVSDKTPRPKKIAAAGSPKPKRARERDVEIGDEVSVPDETVEKRRVSRKSALREIDGFAATRAAMDSK
jgi:hypothetical protein